MRVLSREFYVDAHAPIFLQFGSPHLTLVGAAEKIRQGSTAHHPRFEWRPSRSCNAADIGVNSNVLQSTMISVWYSFESKVNSMGSQNESASVALAF
ncbi:hypothetical protein KIN20_001078 [Parelaphostrongylus tenuis]|uniref:Uncharacterized protein n=1 Tax=Parelaphostrongylus tenuis TaxID=148309 RepID=A0AAD5MEN9_PARTN|nr:hypothetical protein KIN20_001078 [Parelaphostrongylus tenuis]